MTGELGRKRRWLLIAAFGVALAATLFFAVRMTMTAAHWEPGAADDRPLQPWMTPRYVAHARHVPPEVVGEALGLDPRRPPRRMTLAELAAMRGVPVSQLIALLDEAVAAHRETRP